MSLAVSDAVSQVLHTALDGLSQRQNVIADNVANVDTPGFRATSVEFEASLRQAIDSGDFGTGSSDTPGAAHLTVTATPTATPVGVNGNNVDLRKETMAAMQTQFSYQILTRAVTDQYGLLRTAAGA